MPLGREKVCLEWQVAPLGTLFDAPGVIIGMSSWVYTGASISQTITGLTPETPYHWRVRLRYKPGNAMGQVAGRWIHIPWNGWNETDFRTANYSKLYLPFIKR